MQQNQKDYRDLDFSEVHGENLLSDMLQLPSFLLQVKSVCHPLLEKDLYNLPQGMYPGHNYNRFQELLKDAGSKPKANFKSLFFRRMMVWQIVMGAVLSLMAAGMSFAGPIVIRSILQFIQDKKATVEDQARAYQYVVVFAVLYFLRIFVKINSDKIFNRISIKSEQILAALILSKLMRISSSYKKYLEKGDMVNHLINDVRYVRESIETMGMLFGAPATIVAVQIFLFVQVGLYGVSLVIVLLVGAFIQYFLENKMSKVRIQKLNTFEQRVGTNLELLGSIKHLKLLGWEELIPKKNLQYQKEENRYNNIYYLLNSVFELILNVLPTITILIMFVVEQINGNGSGSQFDTVTVYTIISVVSLMYSPAKQLFGQIIKTIDGNNALKRICHLLEAEEMHQLQQATDLKDGDFQAKDLVMSWETEQSYRHFCKRERLTMNKAEEEDAQNDGVSDYSMQKSETEDPFSKYAPDSIVKKPIINCREFSLNDIDVVLHKGDRLVILGFPDSGKTTFINTILGNVNILKGSVKYRGKIGYVSQKTWYRDQWIKNNILMGRKENPQFLKEVYRLAELEQELEFLSHKDRTRMNDTNFFSEGQKKRISIARALYGKPDILLMDDPFISLDNETSKLIYDNICKALTDSLIITATHTASIIRPTDKVLIFENGVAKEYGEYSSLQKTSHLLHKLTQSSPTEESNEAYRLEQQRLAVQRREQIERKKAFHEKIRRLMKKIVQAAKDHSKFVSKLKNMAQSDKIYVKQTNRVPGVSLDVYKMIIKSSKLSFVLLVILTMITYGIKMYSDWWLGQLKTMTDYNQTVRLLIYGGLTIAFGCAFMMAEMAHTWTSTRTSHNIASKSCTSLAYCKLSWFENQKIIKIASRINKDYEKFYGLNSIVQNIVKNITLLLATLILVGLSSPVFYSLGLGILIMNSAILYYFMQAEREVFNIGNPNIDLLNNHYEETISGIDYTRAYGQIDKTIEEFMRLSYRVAIFRENHFGIFKVMEILSQVVSLVLMTCVAIMAVANRFNTSSSELGIIGLTITFSLKIADLTTSLMSDVSRLQLTMKMNMKAMCEIIDKNQEQDYIEPPKPAGWPIDGSIKFDKVSLKYPTVTFPIIKQVGFEVASGQNITICGSQDNGKDLILSAIQKISHPVKNFDASLGNISVGGVNLKDVGRKYVTQTVMYLNSSPFIFTSSIRENLDPFEEHSDQKLVEALKKVKLWDAIEVEFESSIDERQNKLGFVLKDAGANLSMGVLQKLNLARALLRKPLILLCESATSSLDPQSELFVSKLIKSEFTDSTLIEITQSISPIMDSDRVFFFVNGKIKQQGKPLQLLKRGGFFTSMVESLEPELYYKLVGEQKNKQKLSRLNTPIAPTRNRRRSRQPTDIGQMLKYL